MRLPIAMAFCFVVLALVGVSTDLSFAQKEPENEFVVKAPPKTPEEELKCFHLPPGFAMELVACEPAIIKPINMAFDDRGRIWVTQSIEYPFPAKPGSNTRDTIKILEDTDKDGRADKVSTFAENLNIPIGLLPIRHGAIAYSIPNIYRLLDTTGDDHANKRDVLYASIGYRDTHGMTSNFTWGYDGWIYACHGFANDSTLKAADGSSVTMNSGNTYRMKPDGSHIEQYTWGQVNPFGLVFDPLGNLFSADCHTKPIMQLLRGGYYQSFGKPHDGLGFAPEICDHDHGSTALCGLALYDADHFPSSYRDHVFIGNVVTNRINQDRLEKHGSTFKAIQQPDFITCDDPWFRPVNIQLGPDGALYIADFYNRIIGHYEVPLTHPGRDHERGRIWRVVYRGEDGKSKPTQPRANWNKATVAELVEDLGHPNIVVRFKATNQLVERGGNEVISAVSPLLDGGSKPYQRSHGLWVLERLSALGEEGLKKASEDTEAVVRVHVMRILADRPMLASGQRDLLIAALGDKDATVQRVAAEALGLHPGPADMAPLLTLRQAAPKDDTMLIHTVRMALRNHLLSRDLWTFLPVKTWSEADARAVADVCPGAANAEAAGFLMTHLQRYRVEGEDLLRYVHHVARYGNEPALQELLSFAQAQRPDDLRQQAALFRAIYQGTQERGGRLTDAGIAWATALTNKLLAARESDLITAGTELAGSVKMKGVQSTLLALASQKKAAEAQRRSAIDALLAIDLKGNIPAVARILSDGSEPTAFREHLAGVLANTNRPEAHAELIKVLAVAPAGLQSAIARGLAGNADGAARLLETVAAGKASPRLLQESSVFIRLDRNPTFRARLAKLTEGLPPADDRLKQVIHQRQAGYKIAHTDPAVGARVFEKHCAVCHQIGGKGAKVGPQLDGVGNRGLERLLEDLIDPNRNVDQAFRATSLNLKNGQTKNGLVLREEGHIIVLADAQGKEIRVPKSDVDERIVSQLSPMPANLIEQIPEGDFYHLLAYLLAQRPANLPGKSGQ